MSSFNPHTHFGPSSEPIPVGEFLLDASLFDDAEAIAVLRANLQTLSQEDRTRLEHDLQEVDSMRADAEEIMNDAMLMAYVSQRQDEVVTDIASTVLKGDVQRSVKRKGERKAGSFRAADMDDPRIVAFSQRFELDPLRIFRTDGNTASFVVPQRLHHTNIIDTVRPSRHNPKALQFGDVILVASFYDRATFDVGGYFRASQHALISSQTLADLFDCNTCPLAYRIQPPPSDEEDGSGQLEPFGVPGCVVTIDDVAYCDGSGKPDYSDKLISHLTMFPHDPPGRVPTKSFTTFATTPLSSLNLRINEPYYFLHQGNCSHLLMFDLIRAPHADDPKEGYPQTLHVSPSNIQICRVCAKSPASLAVANDFRLGETPSVVCKTCWAALGMPKNPEIDIVVTPLRFPNRID
ncbi:snRNA-activating protein of 50kDa MW C terminal-domain-containing protein [Auriculariales sp. MPI-PUGE-AT-0066]|nr:snRNA-activating protein of 50kDa MW C terminal-domain-containing protein [Auriculariales sp. MPI-PUGE-AT-0066]